jgi:hypothetical protein
LAIKIICAVKNDKTICATGKVEDARPYPQAMY